MSTASTLTRKTPPITGRDRTMDHRKARLLWTRKTLASQGPLGGGYAALGRRCYAQFPRARGFGAGREAPPEHRCRFW